MSLCQTSEQLCLTSDDCLKLYFVLKPPGCDVNLPSKQSKAKMLIYISAWYCLLLSSQSKMFWFCHKDTKWVRQSGHQSQAIWGCYSFSFFPRSALVFFNIRDMTQIQKQQGTRCTQIPAYLTKTFVGMFFFLRWRIKRIYYNYEIHFIYHQFTLQNATRVFDYNITTQFIFLSGREAYTVIWIKLTL